MKSTSILERPRLRNCCRVTVAAALLALAGCSIFQPEAPPLPPPEPPKPALLPPLATHEFPFDPKTTAVVGTLQVTHSRHEDTLADIARRFNLGYDEVLRANPGVDPWLPGEGTRIVLPTQFVLPEAPADGIVVNIAALRMFYFPKPKEKDGPRTVLTFPIGIGKVGWATPVGTTKIVSKREKPFWTPPPSVRKEHAEAGDPLPAQVPPGPDNPLGLYAMNLGWPSYLIHGTNKPPGVGMRASHGCIRMYPEDIATVFPEVPVGMKVTVVNQPLLYRWQDGNLYVQSYPLHEDERDGTGKQKKAPAAKKASTAVEAPSGDARPPHFTEAVAAKMYQRVKPHGAALDLKLAEQVVNGQQGIAVPVTRTDLTFESMVSSARLVENALPEGSTWDGREETSAQAAGDPVATSAQ
jgi:L,D-transpeptidase ErfK/SrfK